MSTDIFGQHQSCIQLMVKYSVDHQMHTSAVDADLRYVPNIALV